MSRSRVLAKMIALSMALVHAPFAAAIAIGPVDTFEDGTTQGWQVALLGVVHPAPPANVADGGPSGAGDNYLVLTSTGGAGPGNRLGVINFAQWAGDYATTGIAAFSMDLRNFGSTDLSVRLYLDDLMLGPPTNQAITSAFALPAGGGWTRVEFAVDAASLIGLVGDVSVLLANVTTLRIFHGPVEAFPGPSVVATLGVDNVTALSARTVPEPSALALLAIGLIAFRWVRPAAFDPGRADRRNRFVARRRR